MHNYHITHKAFLACTIIGSTPSVLGRLLCLSQQYWMCSHQGLLTCLGTNHAFAMLRAWRMIGSQAWLIHPLFQSIRSCVAANQGQPRIALFFSRFKRKNQGFVHCILVYTWRSVKNCSSPSQLVILSMLNNFHGSGSHLIGSLRYFAYLRFMKFLVAPKSTNAIDSALFDFECTKKWTVINFLLNIYTSVVSLQSLKKLSQCLAIWERLTCLKSNKLYDNLKIIYNIVQHRNFWTFLKPHDLDRN